jgi:DNA-binding NarL/FixJ family response regulator
VVPLRTLAVTISPLFCDIVTQSLTRRVPLEIIEQMKTRAGLEHGVVALAPDIILIGLVDNEDSAFALSLARLSPQATVVAFSSDLRRVHACREGCRPMLLVDASPDSLADAIMSLRQQT